jgi:hypothetical protein
VSELALATVPVPLEVQVTETWLAALEPAVILAGVPDSHMLTAVPATAVARADIVRLTLLVLPVTEGELEITRMRYPVPAACPAGIVALIELPVVALAKVPMAVGDVKEPEAFESWAVNVLFAA